MAAPIWQLISGNLTAVRRQQRVVGVADRRDTHQAGVAAHGNGVCLDNLHAALGNEPGYARQRVFALAGSQIAVRIGALHHIPHHAQIAEFIVHPHRLLDPKEIVVKQPPYHPGGCSSVPVTEGVEQQFLVRPQGLS